MNERKIIILSIILAVLIIVCPIDDYKVNAAGPNLGGGTTSFTLSGVNVKYKKNTMTVGDTQTAEITYDPTNIIGASVTGYRSSNPDVISVDSNGKITAKKASNTSVIITVTAKDYYNNVKSGKFEIKKVLPKAAISKSTSITLSKTQLELTTVAPDNVGYVTINVSPTTNSLSVSSTTNNYSKFLSYSLTKDKTVAGKYSLKVTAKNLSTNNNAVILKVASGGVEKYIPVHISKPSSIPVKLKSNFESVSMGLNDTELIRFSVYPVDKKIDIKVNNKKDGLVYFTYNIGDMENGERYVTIYSKNETKDYFSVTATVGDISVEVPIMISKEQGDKYSEPKIICSRDEIDIATNSIGTIDIYVCGTKNRPKCGIVDENGKSPLFREGLKQIKKISTYEYIWQYSFETTDKKGIYLFTASTPKGGIFSGTVSDTVRISVNNGNPRFYVEGPSNTIFVKSENEETFGTEWSIKNAKTNARISKSEFTYESDNEKIQVSEKGITIKGVTGSEVANIFVTPKNPDEYQNTQATFKVYAENSDQHKFIILYNESSYKLPELSNNGSWTVKNDGGYVINGVFYPTYLSKVEEVVVIGKDNDKEYEYTFTTYPVSFNPSLSTTKGNVGDVLRVTDFIKGIHSKDISNWQIELVHFSNVKAKGAAIELKESLEYGELRFLYYGEEQEDLTIKNYSIRSGKTDYLYNNSSNPTALKITGKNDGLNTFTIPTDVLNEAKDNFWENSNSSTFSFVPGASKKITAEGEGEATLRAYNKNGDEIALICLKASKISYNMSINKNVGEKLKISDIVNDSAYDSQLYSWRFNKKSEKQSYSSPGDINGDELVCSYPGKYKITVTFRGTILTDCSLTVTGEAIEPEGSYLSNSTEVLNLKGYNDSFNVFDRFKDLNIDKYYLVSSNTKIAKVTQKGIVSFVSKKEGKVVITAYESKKKKEILFKYTITAIVPKVSNTTVKVGDKIIIKDVVDNVTKTENLANKTIYFEAPNGKVVDESGNSLQAVKKGIAKVDIYLGDDKIGTTRITVKNK